MPTAQSIVDPDYIWQIGNINQLASRTPFNDIRTTGVSFRYHFFSTLFLAIGKMIFGGEGWLYMIQYTALYAPYLFFLSFYVLYKKLIKSSGLLAAAIFSGLAGFSLTPSFQNYFVHWSTNVNAVTMGTACGTTLLCILLSLIQQPFHKDADTMPRIALSTVLLFLLTGTKGPFALIIVLAVLAFTFFLIIRRRKIPKPFLWLGIVFVTVFYVEFQLLLDTGARSYLAGFTPDMILHTVVETPAFSELCQITGTGLFARLVLALPTLAGCIGLTILPLFWGIRSTLLQLFKKEACDRQFDLTFCTIASCGGIAAFLLFDMAGLGQLYFLFSAVPFLGYLAVLWVKHVLSNTKSKFLHSKFSLALLIIFSSITLYANIKPIFLAPSSRAAASFCFLQSASAQSDPIFEGLAYILENTEPDCLIATNKQDRIPGSKDGLSFLISAFGERRCYLEGYEYSIRNLNFRNYDERRGEMRELFGANWTDAEKFAFSQKRGIHYYVIFHEETYHVAPKESDVYDLAFENSAMSIYRLIY